MGKSKSADTQKWYGDVFGWKIDAMPFPGAPEGETYGIVSAQDGKGIGGGVGAGTDGPPAIRIYIEVDEPQAYLDKVVGAGGKVLMPVTEIPEW